MRNEINKALFTDDMIVMLKKPNESLKKKSPVTSIYEFNNVSG